MHMEINNFDLIKFNKLGVFVNILDFEKLSSSLDDFKPDNILQQVDELKQILQLRDALKALKGPIGNSPQMRKQIRELLTNETSRDELKRELGLLGNE